MSNRAQQSNFFTSPASYQQHALIQRRVVAKLSQCLPEGAPLSILEIGSGTGILSRTIRAAYPSARIVSIDLSEQMIQYCQGQKDIERVEFIHVDLLKFEPEILFDMVVSSASLHWIQPIEEALAHIHRLLKPQAQFIASLMLEGTFAELHQCRKVVAPERPLKVRLPEFQRVKKGLQDLAFGIDFSIEQTEVAAYKDPQEFFRVIRAMGVEGRPDAKSRLSLPELIRTKKLYQQLFRNEAGEIPVSYQVGYVRVLKA